MKFVTFALLDTADDPISAQVGLLHEPWVLPLSGTFDVELLTIHDVVELLVGEEAPLTALRRLHHTFIQGGLTEQCLPLSEVRLYSPFQPPLNRPHTLRDFYAFEAHVKNARSRRGLEMLAEWYELPVFYFSNPTVIFGPEDVVPCPHYTQELDYELEVAAVIGRAGINIPISQAESYIAGYTIMNDWSARDIQRKEMKVGLGPAKAKDFATSLGPWLVTPDELADRRSGKGYNLTMLARRNGELLSQGNWADIYFSFAEMIARASDDVYLYPGDVLGSGTVGTGCILELGPENTRGWLQAGDQLELAIERLGVLRNVIGSPSR